jgi:uncharacterized surface protein with fasciclin (FAS1) repeats
VLCCAVLPRIKGQASDVKGYSRSKPLEAITADGSHYLQFFMAPGGQVVLQDVQNNTATVLGKGREVGNTMLYSIDRVLLSGKGLEHTAAAGRLGMAERLGQVFF